MKTRTLDKKAILTRTFELRQGLSLSDRSPHEAASATGRKISGYAAVFSSPAKIDGLFTERILPGAFDETLRSTANDVPLLWNHDTGKPLGRRSAGLVLKVDSRGLFFQCEAPAVSYADDALELLRSGILKGCSFGFNVIRDSWSPDGKKRDLHEVRLIEISLVTFPAYSGTSAQARDADDRSAWMRACMDADIALAGLSLEAFHE